MSIKKGLPEIWAATTFSMLFIMYWVEALSHFQISSSNREDKDETSLTIQNATVDNGPSTSNGGSRQSVSVEDLSMREMYKCYGCKVHFTSRSDFLLHRKSTHKKAIYICDECPLYFSVEWCLSDHIWQVHKGYSFFCDECNKIFMSRELLSYHMTVSHPETILKCRICDKKFSIRGNLVRHMKNKHRILQSNCEFCRKILPHEQLYDHKLEKHNVMLSDQQEFH